MQNDFYVGIILTVESNSPIFHTLGNCSADGLFVSFVKPVIFYLLTGLFKLGLNSQKRSGIPTEDACLSVSLRQMCYPKHCKSGVNILF